MTVSQTHPVCGLKIRNLLSETVKISWWLVVGGWWWWLVVVVGGGWWLVWLTPAIAGCVCRVVVGR